MDDLDTSKHEIELRVLRSDRQTLISIGDYKDAEIMRGHINVLKQKVSWMNRIKQLSIAK